MTEYAYALAKSDRYQEAIDVLDLLDNPNTPRALNYRGYATRKLGRTDEGIGYYLKSVALDPNYPQVREYLGEAYVSRASTISPRSNCPRSRSFAARTASITRIWLAR
jgi:Flp pilus assembly protein TadD